METEETLVKNVSRRKLPEDNKGRRRRQRQLGSQTTQQRHFSVWVDQRNRPIAAGVSLYPPGPWRAPVQAEAESMRCSLSAAD